MKIADVEPGKQDTQPMKTLSFLEYQNKQDVYLLRDKLVALNCIPKNLFVKVAIHIAKPVLHLVEQRNLTVCSEAIATAEKYLRGEATPKQCQKAHSATSAHAASAAASSAYYASAAASATAYYASCAIVSAAPARHEQQHKQHNNAADIFRAGMPWNLVCAAQIVAATNSKRSIEQLAENTQLIDYATIILGSQENLKKEFRFLMKQYL